MRSTRAAAASVNPGKRFPIIGNPMELELPKLIVMDLDGTLLPESKQLTPTAQSVLGELRARGVHLGLATGKFMHLTEPYGALLGADTTLVALDGARIATVGGNGHRVSGIAREQAIDIMQRYRSSAADLFFDNGADELLLTQTHENFFEDVRHWASRRRIVDDPTNEIVGDSGIIALYGEPSEMRAIEQTAGAAFPDLRVTYFDSMLFRAGRVTFQPGGISKASGVDWLRGRIHVEAHETMVFGDWYNDIPLFSAGFTNVAMANAVPEVRALAQYVTPLDCENDGVADFLTSHFLNN